MNIDDKDSSDKVDRYIKGDMSESESIDFENKLKIDGSLFAEVEKQKVIHSIIIEDGLADIRHMLKNDLALPKNISNNKWIGISLTIAILASGIYYVSQKIEKNNSSSSEQLIVPTEQIISGNIKESKTNSNKNTTITKKDIINTPIEHQPKNSNNIKEIVPVNNTLPVVERIKETTTPIDEPLHTTTEENPCSKFKPNYSIKIIPSSVHEITGKIIITTNDNTLRFSLNDNRSSFGNTFENLESGKYTMVIENKIGCTSLYENIVVGKTFCLVLEKETFNPTTENSFLLLEDQKEFTEIRIYDKKMQEIRVFKNGDNTEWDGRNMNGQPVETGLYKIEIRHSNGERCLFNLTVFN